MKSYGGTCPLCSGDVENEHVVRSGDAFCYFFGLSLAGHESGTGLLGFVPLSHVEPSANGFLMARTLLARSTPIGDQGGA